MGEGRIVGRRYLRAEKAMKKYSLFIRFLHSYQLCEHISTQYNYFSSDPDIVLGARDMELSGHRHGFFFSVFLDGGGGRKACLVSPSCPNDDSATYHVSVRAPGA